MSEDISDIQTPAESSNETSADEVKAQAVQDYKSDMFKYKERMKQAETDLEALRAEKSSLERNQLEKNEEWKVLYEKEKADRESAVSNLESKSKQFVDSSKLNAVVQGIGGFKKDEYSRFINPSSIDINEAGTIDSASLQKEVDRIKQEFPELLQASKAPQLPSGAAQSVAPGAPRPLSQMTRAERLALLVTKL